MLASLPIQPKHADGVLRIISIGRLSQPKETADATQQSLEAIRCENERLLKSIYSGPTIVRYQAEQISGMIAERQTMTEIWELVETGEWDLIIAEDLSRVFRNPRFQLAFLQDALDKQIRVICFADNLDTADDNWETAALIALVRHGLSIPDGRRRIKRTATASFKSGGMVVKHKAFYARVSKEDAAAGKYGSRGLRIRKLAEFAWVVDEIRRRLHAGDSPRSIVAWLNRERIPCGPYVAGGRWTKRVLRHLLEDPILHGVRTFRDVVHKQIYGSGKFRREKNPTPDTDIVPELAFMTLAEQEAMLATVGWAIDWGGVQPPQRSNGRKGVSRYESYWPAQAAICSACGGLLYSSGKYLKCSKCFDHVQGTCWNHVQVPVAPLRSAVIAWIVLKCGACEVFRKELVAAAKAQIQSQHSSRDFEREAATARVTELETQERNLRRSIRLGDALLDEDLAALVNDLAGVTKQLREARCEIETEGSEEITLADYDEAAILANLPEVLEHLVGTSFEMAELIRRFVPRCVIVPVQSLDSGQVYPRAKLYVRNNIATFEELKEIVVDLFEPALHVKILPQALKLRAQDPRPTLKQIGKALGVSYMTVKRGLAYARLMAESAMTEPYRELDTKPTNAARWREAS